MSRAKNTPWVAIEHSWSDTSICDGAGKVVASLTIRYDASEENQAELEAEMAVHANIMAAAPDLLEALQEAVECGMVPVSSAKNGGANSHVRQLHVADMIRAAIAKALGEDAAELEKDK